MPAGHDVVFPIRRPRAFARAPAAMAAEQPRPPANTLLLRSSVDEQVFRTARRSPTVYHGPVVYADDPVRRLEAASSDLELLLLPVFVKQAEYRAQREYRAVWSEDDPKEDTVDLPISPPLLDAVERPPQDVPAGGFAPAGPEASPAAEALAEVSPPAERVDVLPAAAGNPTVAPRRYDAAAVTSDLREPATAYASLEGLRDAVDRADASGATAAAAACHREPVVRLLCSTFGDRVAGLRVNEECLVVTSAELPGAESVEACVAVGPEGTIACRISAGAHASSVHDAGRSAVQGSPEAGAGQGWVRDGTSEIARVGRPPAESRSRLSRQEQLLRRGPSSLMAAMPAAEDPAVANGGSC